MKNVLFSSKELLVLIMVMFFFAIPFFSYAQNSNSIETDRTELQYFTISDSAQSGLDLETDFTIEAWVKFETLPSLSAPTEYGIVSKYKSITNERAYRLIVTENDQLQLTVSDDGTTSNINNITSAEVVITPDQLGMWIHFAGTYDLSNNTGFLYKNGTILSSNGVVTGTVDSILNNTEAFAVGLSNAGTENSFDGLLDEVRIWNDIRTDEEIVENYLRELIGDEENLVGYWKFNNSLLDETPNNNDLIFSLNPQYSEDVPFGSDPDRPLYTQIESEYPSLAETTEWADDEYAWGGDYWCGNTIAGCGCALTSLVMLGRDNGITTGVDGEDLNPASVNNWLKENNGFDSSGNVFWSKVSDYFGSEEDDLVTTPLRVLNHKVIEENSIRQYVQNENTSVLGYSAAKGHFFYLSDTLEQGFEILDPLWYETVTTNDEKDIANNTQDYNDSVNRGVVYELVEARVQTGVLEATLSGPAELLLTNEAGDRSGYVEDEGVVEEIEDSGYVQDEILASSDDVLPETFTKRLLATNLSGLNELYVVGTEAGEYALSLLFKDKVGVEYFFEHLGDTTPGQIDIFSIDFEAGEIIAKPVDRDLFLLATARATEDKTEQTKRFFERWGEKIFDEIDRNKVSQAIKHTVTFGTLQKAKKVVDSWLDALRERLQDDLEESESEG